MLNTIVLDACTIINLLRIDDLDGFLMNKLRKYSCWAFPEEVLNEVYRNAKRNSLDPEREAFIDMNVQWFLTYRVDNRVIKAQSDMWDYVINTAKHLKRDNGELYSTVLCLMKSRENQMRSLFFTDDFPAHKEFQNVFQYQQIGYIADTAHFLLFLFCNSTKGEFNKDKLLKFLTNLLTRYNKDKKEIVDQAEKIKESLPLRNHTKLRSILSSIVDGFYFGKECDFLKGISELNKYNAKDYNTKKLLNLTHMFHPLLSETEQGINEVINHVRQHHIFQCETNTRKC